MTASVQEIAGKVFDYVIIGGGTAGLTVAGRLAENPNVTVAVLEAGPANLDDPLINIPAQFGMQLGNTKYSWDFTTVPQKTANDAVYTWSRGRTLGGSSAVNFYIWTKPPASDIDAWEKLGNPGWNAARFFEYSKKVESFSLPMDETLAKSYQQVVKPDAHGYTGPLKTVFPSFVSPVEFPYQKTLSEMGIKKSKDPMNGDPYGSSMVPSTLDPVKHTRSYSTTAFYLPNKDKPNFHVLCDALVHRMVVKDNGSGAVAEAVEFEHGGTVYTVRVGKEVIVSAGALKTPQILELSGIGDARILEKNNVKTVVDLPGVGANMQEHSMAMMVVEIDPKSKLETLDTLYTNPEYASEQLSLHGEGKGVYRLGLSGFTFVPLATVVGVDAAQDYIKRQKAKITEKINSGVISKGLQAQYKIQLEKLESGQNGDCEVMLFPGAMIPTMIKPGHNRVSMNSAINLPFSRGTIHIKSSDPNEQPAIDPHMFEDTFDLDVFVEIYKFNRKMCKVGPWKDVIGDEVFPGGECVSDEDIRNFLKKYSVTTFHTASTASMLPREFDGVVDPKLLVYGTKNIRVADLSIVPLHIAAHTQSTAYTIGEIAADIVKGKI